jgi:hypothetical protein
MSLHAHGSRAAAECSSAAAEAPTAASSGQAEDGHAGQQAERRQHSALPLDWDCCRDIIARAAYPISAWV